MAHDNAMTSGTPPVSAHSLDECAALIDALDRVPRDEMPNGALRQALTRAIVAGEIDALYRPLGASAHNVCIAGTPPDVDPRITLAQWAACWRAQVSALGVILSAHVSHVSIADALEWASASAMDATPDAPATPRQGGC